MGIYDLAKKFLFMLDPEVAHKFALNSLSVASKIKISNLYPYKNNNMPTTVMGLNFANPIGVAAGLDKNGDYIDALGDLGFGFIEVGTVTPKPQYGNPKPRMFRIVEQQALINRMGFNNYGVDHLVANLKNRKYSGILGVNIGKNASTPIENAIEDYIVCMDSVYIYADYITINISSPNTKSLTSLQEKDNFRIFIEQILAKRISLEKLTGKKVPLVVKLSPDLSLSQIKDITSIINAIKLDGVIATNTTVNNLCLKPNKYSQEKGGISGSPLSNEAEKVTKILFEHLDKDIPIIGVGGIMSGKQAATRMQCGAKLLQVYTGFIFKGPSIIKDIIDNISK